MKKGKKRRVKRPVQFKTEPDIFTESDNRSITFLGHDEYFNYECSRCGECCRNVEYSVMLESYDLYRIAKYLKQAGYGVSGVEQIITEYAEPKLLSGSDYPLFLLKTQGRQKSCVFLKEERCTIHETKPRACRLYPMGAWPNDTMDGFDYFIASKKQHHFAGSAIRVSDWMGENFREPEREITILDAKAVAELAPIIRGLQRAGVERDRILQPLILFKYVYFELDKPYVPQFMRNIGLLKNALLKMAGQ